MKEFSKEKLLKFMDDVERHIEEITKNGIKGRAYAEAVEIVKTIKKLIQNQPEVNEEFIKKHARIIFRGTPCGRLNLEIWKDRIQRILKLARVKIKEN